MTMLNRLTSLLFVVAIIGMGGCKKTEIVFDCPNVPGSPPPYTLRNGGLVCPANFCAQGCERGQTCVENTETHDRWCAVCNEQTRICNVPEVEPDAAVIPTARNDAGVEPDMMTAHIRQDAGMPQHDAAPTPECVSDADCHDGKLCMSGTCRECTTDSQCSGTTPYCNTAMDPSQCVQCKETSDCGTCTGDVCFGGSCVTVPGGELCDGADNNCDGHIDEGFTDLGQTCSAGVGACWATGTRVCLASGLGTTCTAIASIPTTLTDDNCNGIDDNCNGTADEGFTPVESVCGIGVCQRMGMFTCEGGRLVNSCTASMPSVTIDDSCNNLDDDCDGAVDEDFVPEPRECGVGACHSVGLTACVMGSVIEVCSPGSPSVEICNGIDDDCDGVVDNDQPTFTTTCGIGVCVSTGTASCEGGAYTDSCTPLLQRSTDDSTCNGVDDNCNGSNDEDFVPEPRECGVGVCHALGATQCVDGVSSVACTPGTPAAIEDCSTPTDDNCNGSINEGCACVPGATRACGPIAEGACHQGTQHCDTTPTGSAWSSCEGAVGPSTETCDGVDNDCNGTVDEGCDDDEDGYCDSNMTLIGTPEVCPSGGGDCNDTAPTVHPGATDICNGVDDNCNGVRDEGFVPLTVACGVGGCRRTVSTSCVGGVVMVPVCMPGTASAEVCGNSVDEDCDGTAQACPPSCTCTDGDGDGYLPPTACTTCTLPRTDCNDSNPAVHPGATAVCGDGIDNNCTGGDTPCPPTCGNGTCAGTETCSSCPADCGTCPTPITPDSITIGITDSASTSLALQTDITATGPSGWDNQTDTSTPFSWTRSIGSSDSTSELYRFNIFRTPAGNWICEVPAGGPPTCVAMPTVTVNGTPVTVLAYDAARTSIPAGQIAVIRDPRYTAGNVANFGYCRGTVACEINCTDGVDNDGDGRIDRTTGSADSDCL